MVRRGEITREKALQLYRDDNILEKSDKYSEILKFLDLSDKDLENIIKVTPLKYEKYTSKMNKLFERMMKIKRIISN